MLTWRRRLRRVVLFGVATIAIVLALAAGVLQLALPWWASNPDRVARLLSSRLGTPVSIQETQSYWSVGGPLIELRGVRFGDAGGVQIERASWAMDLSGLVRRDRPLYEFGVHGLDLTLARSAEGRWQLRGLPTLLRGDGGQPMTRVLRSLPALSVRESRLRVLTSETAQPLAFHLPELHRFDQDGVARWRGRLTPGTGSSSGLQLSVDVGSDEQARVHLAGEDLAVADWLGGYAPAGVQLLDGRLDLAAWIDLDAGGIRDGRWQWYQGATRWRAQSVAAGDSVDVEPPADAQATVVDLPMLRVAGRWHREGTEGQLLVHELVFGDHDSGRLAGWMRDGRLRIQGSDLHVTPLAAVLALAQPVPEGARRWLVEGRPEGRIDRLQIDVDPDGLRQYGAVLSQWHSTGVPGGIPGVRGLDATIRGDREGLIVVPGREPLTVDMPGILPEPATGRIDAGVITAWREADGWKLGSDALTLSGDGFHADVAGSVALRAGERPYLDFGGEVSGDLLQSPRFMPINKLANTRAWIARSLTAGKLVGSHTWFRGPAVALPFPGHSGHFEAALEVTGAALDYHADWPGLHDVSADLLFENGSLTITGRQASIGGLTVTGASAHVPNLREAVMRIRGSDRDSGEALLAFMAQTPLQQRFGDHLRGMTITGQPRVEIHLHLPFKRELGEMRVEGKVRFDGERWHDSARNLRFDDLRGELVFDRQSLTAHALDLTVAGEPARLDLRIGASTNDAQMALEAGLAGRLSMAAALDSLPQLAGIGAASEGRADWRVALALPEQASGRQGSLRVDSDLRGIALNLPDPLRKPAQTALPLRVDVAVGQSPIPVKLHLGNLVAMDARVSEGDNLLAAIALGGGEPEMLPQRGLVITGHPAAFDVGGWLAMPWGEGKSSAWPQMQLRTGELNLFGRALNEVDLRVEPRAETVYIAVTGPEVDGNVLWPLAVSADRPVRVDLKRLHLPDAAPGGGEGPGDDPATLPALEVSVADFRTGAIALGAVSMRAHPADGGYRIEQFRSSSPLFTIEANGDWRIERGQERSQFVVDLRADDLGKMLTSLGFNSQVEGGSTQARIDGGWQGAPAAFALEKIEGLLTLSVGSGRILEVDPGMGRLFGLLNLREIPRRLMLDFRDIFSQGMRFTSIEGSFRLDVGNAWTEAIAVKSPAADIVVSGRTGLTDRDYDQTLRVMPRVGGTLPVVGAIAGGPAGAAAGLVMQGLLRLDDASSIVYRVTGPWTDPVITRIEETTGEPVAGVSPHP